MLNDNNKYTSDWSDVGLVILILMLFSVGFYTMLLTLDLPTVMFSNSTGECVEVINYTEDTNYSCNNMPTRYEKVWVK